MRCPRCGNEMAEDAPCARCGARVRHVRRGAEPDFTVRRVRLDTPPHLRALAAGLPRLRREPTEAAGRGRLYAVVLGTVVALLVVGFAVFLALGGGAAPADSLPAPRGPDAREAPDAAPRRVPLPAQVPALPPGAALSAAPPAPDTGTSAAPGAALPAPGAPPLVVGVTATPDGGPVTVLPIGRYGVAVPPQAGPEIPASVLQIAAVPSGPAAASCAPSACTPAGNGWVVADKARELLDSDPAQAACWAEETVRQGRRFNVPALIASGYFHLALAFRKLDCRERAHAAFLSALCEGRTTVRPSLLESYRQACDRTGEGCDAPCRDDRYIVTDQPLTPP